MRLLCSNDDLDIHPWKAAFWIMVAFLVLSFLGAVTNIMYVEGVPITVQGRVQLHAFKHNKFWGYDYTFIELQTFSGDVYHYTFLKHIDLEFDEVYRIKYTRTSLFGHHMDMYNKVLEIERLGVEG